MPLLGLLNDMTPCCDAHDLCYATCGTTQGFCDAQLGSCMRAQASMPGCDTTVDVTALLVDLLGCSAFTDAQVRASARRDIRGAARRRFDGSGLV